MSSITYGGIRYDQVRHAIYCTKCEMTIESKGHYDYKICSCGSVGLDGGIEAGNRILGDLSFIETRAIYVAIVNNKKIYLPQEIIERRFNAQSKKI